MEIKTLVSASALLIASAAAQAAPSANDPWQLLFHVNHEQYSRALQMLRAKGLFSSYKHSCEMETNGYRCEDHADGVVVVYYSDSENLNINSITIGSTPEDTELASSIAATAAFSLNAQNASLQEDAKKLSVLRNDINSKMETVFVRGGSDISFTKYAMLMFMMNNAKDMVLVRVVPSDIGGRK